MIVNSSEKGPVGPASENQKGSSSAEPAPVTSGVILVVDDNPLNAELVTDLLEMHGFHVQSTDTAEAALIMARTLMPALILMDINLPGMDGISATKILKNDPATRHLTVIGLTAEPTGEARRIFDGCLSKPFNTHTFADSIKSFLSKFSRVQ